MYGGREGQFRDLRNLFEILLNKKVIFITSILAIDFSIKPRPRFRLVRDLSPNKITSLIAYIQIPPSIDEKKTSADLNYLRKVMLQLMRENKETLELSGRGGLSAEAINFLEATSLASLTELSDVSTDSLVANHC